MIFNLIISYLPLIFLGLIGTSLYQKMKLDSGPILNILNGFAIAIVYLYFILSLIVRFEILKNYSHWLVLFFPIIYLAFLEREKIRIFKMVSFDVPKKHRVWIILFFILIIYKLVLALYINLNFPIFDSDAAADSRWVGLAKQIYYKGWLSPDIISTHSLGPSLISFWINRFAPRWSDSITAFYWYLIGFQIIVFMGITIFKLTRNKLVSLFSVFMVVFSPLFFIHLIRPGFSDLIVAYFLIGLVSHLLFLLYSGDKKHLYVSLIFFLGALLTKKEALIWSLIIYFCSGSVYLYKRNKGQLKSILFFELLIIFIFYTLYLLLAEKIRSNFILTPGLENLFIVTYDVSVIKGFLVNVFGFNSFGLLWWFYFSCITILFIKTKNRETKFLITQMVIIWLIFFYASCFTGNGIYVLLGGNTGRGLMQLLFLILPLPILAYAKFEKGNYWQISG